jgi:hypothetical protein
LIIIARKLQVAVDVRHQVLRKVSGIHLAHMLANDRIRVDWALDGNTAWKMPQSGDNGRRNGAEREAS